VFLVSFFIVVGSVRWTRALVAPRGGSRDHLPTLFASLDAYSFNKLFVEGNTSQSPFVFIVAKLSTLPPRSRGVLQQRPDQYPERGWCHNDEWPEKPQPLPKMVSLAGCSLFFLVVWGGCVWGEGGTRFRSRRAVRIRFSFFFFLNKDAYGCESRSIIMWKPGSYQPNFESLPGCRELSPPCSLFSSLKEAEEFVGKRRF